MANTQFALYFFINITSFPLWSLGNRTFINTPDPDHIDILFNSNISSEIFEKKGNFDLVCTFLYKQTLPLQDEVRNSPGR